MINLLIIFPVLPNVDYSKSPLIGPSQLTRARERCAQAQRYVTGPSNCRQKKFRTSEMLDFGPNSRSRDISLSVI